jgi:hypothetical protein
MTEDSSVGSSTSNEEQTMPPSTEPAVRVDESTPQFSTSPTIGKLATALARVQKIIKQPTKRADNPFFKSKYADLHEVWAAVRGALSDEGIAVIQSPAFSTAELKGKVIGIITISTTLVHGASGEWMTNVLRGTSENIGPQAIGSAISYFRRYSLQPLLMLTPDDGSDDDAERAEGRTVVAPEDKPSAEDITKHTNGIKGAGTLDALRTAYANIPEAHRKFFNKLVNARKAALEKAAGPSDPEGDSSSPRDDEPA